MLEITDKNKDNFTKFFIKKRRVLSNMDDLSILA